MPASDTDDANQSPRDRALRLSGRIQALADVAEAFNRFSEWSPAWRDFEGWMRHAEDEVLAEFEMAKAELGAGKS